MEPYFITVTASVLLAQLTLAMKGRGAYLQYIVPCIPFCLLAALRDPAIGTDTQGYVVPIFEYSKNVGLGQLMSSYYIQHFEPLFLLVVWFASALTHQFEVVCFILQFLVVLPIMRLGYKLDLPIWLISIVYGLCFFPFSLNIIRQSIAIAIMIQSIPSILKRDYRKIILNIIIAYFFHRTSILWIAIFPLGMVLSNEEGFYRLSRRATEFLLILGSFFLIIYFIIICFGKDLLAIIPFYTETISAQLSYDAGGFTASGIFLLISATAVLFLTKSNNIKEKYLKYILYLIIMIGACLQQMSLIGSQLARAGMTFLFAFVPMCGICYKYTKKESRLVVFIIILITSIFYFIWVYVYGNSGNVIPYRFNQ